MNDGADQLDVFCGSEAWARLPEVYLKALASHFNSPASAQEFRLFFECNGLLEKLVASNLSESNANIAISLTATLITSLGYRLAKADNYIGAKYAWNMSLKIEPNHGPTWSGLAVLSFNEEDYASAAKWARKLIDLSLSHKSDTYQDRLNDDVLSGRFENEAADGMAIPQIVGSSEAIIGQMYEILAASQDQLSR